MARSPGTSPPGAAPPGRAAGSRHGRGPRGSITGPVLPPLRTRAETFEATVASTAQYLRDFWPDELADVVFAVAGLPDSENDAGGMDRWRTERTARRIVLFRHPIERLAKLGRDDDIHRRILVENAVFRAVGELLGKDPWELAPDRYRHLD